MVPDPQKAIAALLLMLAPAALAATLAASASLEVAALMLLDPPKPSRAGAAQIAASRDEWLYRAWYGINAFKRVAGALLRGGGEPFGERLGKAMRAERRYFDAHRLAGKRRMSAARLADAAAERYGPILGWHAMLDEDTTPECREAHGKNFDVRNPPAIGLPGTLHGGRCRCSAGAPFQGAEMLPGGSRIGSSAGGGRSAGGAGGGGAGGSSGGPGGPEEPDPEWFRAGTVDRRKLDEYLLSPTHPDGRNKLRLWSGVFGIGEGDGEVLERLIREQLSGASIRERPPVTGREGETHRIFEVLIPDFRGPNGNVGPVITGWALDPGEENPHLTTAYPAVE